MKDVYPEYAQEVDFYAVASSSALKLSNLENYRAKQNHPWPVAEPLGSMLKDFKILQQSTKIAFDARGVIIYRDGYGAGDPETWSRVFEELSASQ